MHNPWLLPGVIAGGGVAAAGIAAGVASAANNAQKTDNAAPSPPSGPTFPPIGPTLAPVVGIRARETADDADSGLSGFLIFLIIFAIALCGIGLYAALWYCCCHRKKRSRGYDRVDYHYGSRGYDPVEAEMAQQYSPRIMMPSSRSISSEEPPPLVPINFDKQGPVSAPVMMQDYRYLAQGHLGHNYNSAGALMYPPME
jgi:hypothetical protein